MKDEVVDVVDAVCGSDDSNVPEGSDLAGTSDVPDIPEPGEFPDSLLQPARKCDDNNSKLERVSEYLASLVGLMKE